MLNKHFKLNMSLSTAKHMIEIDYAMYNYETFLKKITI